MLRKCFLLFIAAFFVFQVNAQDNILIKNLVNDERQHSQLENLGTELIDRIGARLTGSPQMKMAQDWVIEKYKNWNIAAENQQWGLWRGWERGISHIDMIYPRVQTLRGTQLAWSPKTPANGITAEVIMIPFAEDSIQFKKQLSSVKGKMVMISMPQLTGRSDDNWEKFAQKESFEKMKTAREKQSAEWQKQMNNTGFTAKTLQTTLENAGAVGLISSYWSKAYGANKIFGANTKKIPVVDLSLEDYGMLYRLIRDGQKPMVRIVADSKETGLQPTFNTIATIKGVEKPDEYVMLSAHLDSWDGGTGATDNGTGTLVMMEAMRLLKKWYPNPKRTIIAGHWESEEQGLNGSRAFVKDHPEIVQKIQAVFNQDGGTGRLNFINGAGFLQSYDFLGRWLSAIPKEIASEIQIAYPGAPSTGGSDNASFLPAGIPSYYLGTVNWDYGTVTWHTNLDTYDKIVFDDLISSVIATAIFAYMASEEPELVSREKIKLPTGNKWPEAKDAIRKGGVDN
jgi:hypothetical protein